MDKHQLVTDDPARTARGFTNPQGSLSVGISGYKRNATVAIAGPGGLLAACQQDRISRVKDVGIRTGGFPFAALTAALESAGAQRDDIGRLMIAEPEVKAVCDQSVREVGHHCGHASTAFYTSPFDEALVVICDTSAQDEVSVWRGRGTDVERLDVSWRGAGFASVYSRLTGLLGFASGAEAAVESLARLQPSQTDSRAMDLLRYADGSLIVAPGFDEYVSNARERSVEDKSKVAAAVQERLGSLLVAFLEDIVSRHGTTPRLCLGGGLFFNSYLNAVVRQSAVAGQVHIPVNPGNAGIAIGCALASAGAPRSPNAAVSPFLGPAFTNEQIKGVLDNCKLGYAFLNDGALLHLVAEALARGELVGWFGGRLEWGPRALGNRSIFASPASKYVLENLNRFLKQRPAHSTYGVMVREEDAAQFFENPVASPYMECDLQVRDVDKFAHLLPGGARRLRVQTVPSDALSPRQIISAFEKLSGLPLLLNTSFNGFHEPIVCSPRDAVRVFYGSGLDLLVMGNFVVTK